MGGTRAPVRSRIISGQKCLFFGLLATYVVAGAKSASISIATSTTDGHSGSFISPALFHPHLSPRSAWIGDFRAAALAPPASIPHTPAPRRSVRVV